VRQADSGDGTPVHVEFRSRYLCRWRRRPRAARRPAACRSSGPPCTGRTCSPPGSRPGFSCPRARRLSCDRCHV